MDAINVISQIGEDSNQIKERKKLQQFEYAQQLLQQQKEKLQKNDNIPGTERQAGSNMSKG
jgi:hypothetical protein